MTISEAVQQGIVRIRKPHWGFETDYLELNITKENGKRFYGPWALLHTPKFAEAVKQPDRAIQQVMVIGDAADDWEEYKGPLHECERPEGW